MTVVGKILVFVNLVFSLVVGGLVTVAYMTRVNWEDYSKKVNEQYQAAEAARGQAVSELTSAKQQYDEALAKIIKDRDDALGQREEARRQLATAQTELATVRQSGLKENADAAAASAAADARKSQIAELQNQVQVARDENLKIIRDKNTERQERIRAEVEAKTLLARNVELEDQVKELAREVARGKAGLGTDSATVVRKRGDENPPKDNIEGSIVSTDAAGDLVRISVGSDEGLVKGHTLKVFRLDKVPENSKYLGTIEILNVRPHEAVGRPLRRPITPLQPGDRVASRIVVSGS